MVPQMQLPFERFSLLRGLRLGGPLAPGSARIKMPIFPAQKRRCYVVCHGDWLHSRSLANERPAAPFDRPATKNGGSAVFWMKGRGATGVRGRRRWFRGRDGETSAEFSLLSLATDLFTPGEHSRPARHLHFDWMEWYDAT
jgi:hypothetical protein